MCGIFAVCSENPIRIGPILHDGLLGLQHRGQEGTGVMISIPGQSPYNSKRISSGDSSVRHLFEKTPSLSQLVSPMAIGHNRYSTAGATSRMENLQPFVRKTKYGYIGVAHNGTLLDVEEHRSALMQRGYSFGSDSDTEIILGYLTLSPKSDLVPALIESLRKIQGAYSLLVMDDHKIIAARDPHGFRPLSLATFNEGYMVSSETCAFGFIEEGYGVKYLRDVEPGEVVIISQDSLESIHPFPVAAPHPCVFELIYFGRPDSKIFSRYGYEFRMELGKRHGHDHRTVADCVIGIPDSANYFADGLAESLGIPHRHALVRSHYATRTFIAPDAVQRSNNVRLKLSPVGQLIVSRRICLGDDSIVRGTTSEKLVSMMRSCSPKSISFAVGCPPIVSHCPFGIDIKSRDELIAGKKTIKQIRDFIGADELHYLSLASLQEVAGPNFCYGCFTGKYPI